MAKKPEIDALAGGAAFRELGHELVDRIADFLDGIPDAALVPPLVQGQSLQDMRARLGEGGLPETGADPRRVLDDAFKLLEEGVRINAHPRSWSYVIGSAAPVGMLADLLAAAFNPNVTAWDHYPMAAEIEGQTVRWVAELLGYPVGCGGLFTSGGNVANLIGVLAARRWAAGADLREGGLAETDGGKLRLYATDQVHTWLDKMVEVTGLGTAAITRVATDADQRMDVGDLAVKLAADRAAGLRPFLICASAGTVSTGAVDPLAALADLAEAEDLWLHIDGAYGAPAVASPLAPEDMGAMGRANSLAVDGHKWLLAPLEAGIALVRDKRQLLDAFSFRPSYYAFGHGDEEVVHYYNYGIQNSRCLRALKVWTILRCLGRQAYAEIVDRNIRLARMIGEQVQTTAELEPGPQGLSIATFRYVPREAQARLEAEPGFLNELNKRLVGALQRSGIVHVSNAVIDGRFLVRACITNFRTTEEDVRLLPDLAVRLGRDLLEAG